MPADAPILVKRYALRRFYDITNGRYVTVAQLRGWAARGVRFTVIDTNGADITAGLLA